jgi:hypothetical protein
LSSGHTPQQNSRYTPRLSTLLMFGIRRVWISSQRPTILREMFLSHPQQQR